MKVIHGLEKVDPLLSQSVLSIGNFDGVHCAHRELLDCSRRLADDSNAPVVIVTFEPHPLTILTPERAPPRLTSLVQKLHHFESAGADITVIAKSNTNLLGHEATEFVEQIVLRLFRPIHIVEGPSFRFGRGRLGTPDLLRKELANTNCDLHIVEPVTIQLEIDQKVLVSSSLIRRLLTDGHVEHAAICLARPYSLIAMVIHGDGRGRKLGLPTANLGKMDQVIPATGVYAGEVRINEKTCLAAISIGTNPTFQQSSTTVEVHVLDFDADLYGQTIELSFHRRLRSQRAFDSTNQLVQQIHRDVENVRCGFELTENGLTLPRNGQP